MRPVRYLVFAGSVRAGSYNAKLAALMAKELALADAEVTHISLKEYPLPLYDGDDEKERGAPENAHKLKRLIQKQDGVFIACPEYNASITPLLKNTLDWVSRLSDPGEPASVAFKQPVFAIGAASPGGFGGMRGLIGMRTILEVGLGAKVIPQMISVGNAQKAFNDKGDLEDERTAGMFRAVASALQEAAKFRVLR